MEVGCTPLEDIVGGRVVRLAGCIGVVGPGVVGPDIVAPDIIGLEIGGVGEVVACARAAARAGS
jgi:hypothetical protein